MLCIVLFSKVQGCDCYSEKLTSVQFYIPGTVATSHGNMVPSQALSTSPVILGKLLQCSVMRRVSLENNIYFPSI